MFHDPSGRRKVWRTTISVITPIRNRPITQFGISIDFPGSTGSSVYAIEIAHNARKKSTIVPNQKTIRPIFGLTHPPLKTRGHRQKAIHPMILQNNMSRIAQKIFDDLLDEVHTTNTIVPVTMNENPQALSTQSGTWIRLGSTEMIPIEIITTMNQRMMQPVPMYNLHSGDTWSSVEIFIRKRGKKCISWESEVMTSVRGNDCYLKYSSWKILRVFHFLVWLYGLCILLSGGSGVRYRGYADSI